MILAHNLVRIYNETGYPGSWDGSARVYVTVLPSRSPKYKGHIVTGHTVDELVERAKSFALS
jgi:hypothetical protein